jgi:YggT family protein
MSYFGNAGQLLVNTFFGLAMIVVLLRIVLQACGANFYNPICQILHRITQPAIGPLRRFIPPIGRIETAAVILVWLISMLKFYALGALGGAIAPLPAIAVAGVADVISLLLWIWFWALLAGVILSWIPVDNRNPAVPLVYQITEPLLTPIRRLLPDIGIDLSPMIAIIGVQLLRILVVTPLFDLAARLAIST